MEISEARQVRVQEGDTSFVFLADHVTGRLVVRREDDDAEEVCAVTVGSRDELDAFLTGLRRVLGVGEGRDGQTATEPSPPGRPAGRELGAAPSQSGGAPEDRDAAIERARERNPQAFKPWSKGEEQRLAEAYEQGRSIAQLAKDHQRSQRAIDMRLQKLGRR